MNPLARGVLAAIIPTCLALAAPATAAAQASAPTPTAESGVTFGGAAGLSSEGYMLGAQLGLHRPGRDWLLRGTIVSDIEVLSETDAVGGFGVLRGWRTDTPDGSSWRRVAVGLSVDYAEVYEEDTSGACGTFGCAEALDTGWGVGLALQGDIGFDIANTIGLSVTGQGSLNTAKSWFAVGVAVTLGPTSLYR